MFDAASKLSGVKELRSVVGSEEGMAAFYAKKH
jgi:hypothetical protein